MAQVPACFVKYQYESNKHRTNEHIVKDYRFLTILSMMSNFESCNPLTGKVQDLTIY